MISYFPQLTAGEWEGLVNHRQGVGFSLWWEFPQKPHQTLTRKTSRVVRTHPDCADGEGNWSHHGCILQEQRLCLQGESHGTVGWVHWGKPHWWWRRKRETKALQLVMGDVRRRPIMSPGWAGRRKRRGGQTSIQISSRLCTHLLLLKAGQRGVLMPNNWKKKKTLQFVLYNIPTSQQNFMKYDGSWENSLKI